MKGFKCIEDFTISDCCSFLKIEYSKLPEVLNNIQATENNSKVIAHIRKCLEKDRNKFASCSTIKQYKAYLSAYPDGLYRRQAAEKIDLLKAEEEEKSFYDANKLSIAGCEAYLKRYPNGRFAKDASLRREDFYFIKWKNSQSGCEQYLVNFPNGRHVAEAKRKIDKAKKNRRILLIATIIIILLLIIGFNGAGQITFSNANDAKQENQHHPAHPAVNIYLAYSSPRMLVLPSVVIAQSSNNKKIHFSKEGGSQEVNFSSGADDDNIEIYTSSSWINVSKSSAGKIVISVSKNEGAERSGTIEVKAYSTLFGIRTSSSTGTIHVTQATGYASYINAIPNDITFSKDGGTKNIKIETDGYWDIEDLIPVWVNVTRNGDYIILNAKENSGASRSGSFIVKSGRIERQINISQKERMSSYLIPSLTDVSISHTGGTRTVLISADGTWSIGVGTRSWIDLSVSGNTITLDIEENSSSASRDDYFTIKSGNLEKRINISQTGKSATRLSVSTDNVSFSSSGGSRSITVSTDGEWRISTETNSWGHTSINGNTITLRVDANDGDSRTDYFVVKSGSMEKRINISQDGSLATYLRLSKSTIEASRSGTGYNECYAVDVYTDGDNVTATTSASWIDVDVVGGDRIEIETSKNTGSRRTATITVKADRQSKQIKVSQKGISNCTNCYNWQYGYSTGQVWGVVGYYYVGWTQFPQYGWVQCPVCGGSGTIEN